MTRKTVNINEKQHKQIKKYCKKNKLTIQSVLESILKYTEVK